MFSGSRCACCRPRSAATRQARSRRAIGTQVEGAYADRVLDIIESYAPGLKAKILGRSVFSPLDLERDNPNLVGGDQICGSHHLSQNFLFRPVRGWARWNTPVERPQHDRRIDLAGRRDRRRLGLHAGASSLAGR